MKKALFILFVLALFPLKSFAAQAGKLGVGVIGGQPFGPTLEYWINEKAAVDLGAGFNHDGIIYGDYLWHGWELRPRGDEGRLGFYAGLGGRFENQKHQDDKYAARVPFGVSFIFNKYPIELFGELVPVIQFSPESDLDLDGGIGARVYFSGIR